MKVVETGVKLNIGEMHPYKQICNCTDELGYRRIIPYNLEGDYYVARCEKCQIEYRAKAVG